VRHNISTSAELERITIDSGNAGKVFRFQANYGGVYGAINLINWRISTLSSMYSTSSVIGYCRDSKLALKPNLLIVIPHCCV
jgi:hypothetical protein